MATVTKEWTNGDLLTLVTSAGGIAVSSDENLTGADREMTIRVQTTNQGTKAFQDVLIKQNKLVIVEDGYWVHKDTGVKTDFELDADFITDGIMSTPSWAFDCSEVNIPEGVTHLGEYCFYDCFSLTSITLPESLTSLGGMCFYNCASLTSITFPDSLTSIEWQAFYNCSSLTSITLPEGLTSIEYATFSYCSSLTSITLPDSLTSIGPFAFDICSALTSITLPEGVTSIGEQAFSSCISLSLVTSLPTIPPSLGSEAFYNTHANLIIKVPAQSVNAYKTATNWNSYASIISAI